MAASSGKGIIVVMVLKGVLWYNVKRTDWVNPTRKLRDEVRVSANPMIAERRRLSKAAVHESGDYKLCM